MPNPRAVTHRAGRPITAKIFLAHRIGRGEGLHQPVLHQPHRVGDQIAAAAAGRRRIPGAHRSRARGPVIEQGLAAGRRRRAGARLDLAGASGAG